MGIGTITYKATREPFKVVYDYKHGDGFAVLRIYRNAAQVAQTIFRGVTDEKLLYKLVGDMTTNDFYDIIHFNIAII
jgi:hypothetical protein